MTARNAETWRHLAEDEGEGERPPVTQREPLVLLSCSDENSPPLAVRPSRVECIDFETNGERGPTCRVNLFSGRQLNVAGTVLQVAEKLGVEVLEVAGADTLLASSLSALMSLSPVLSPAYLSDTGEGSGNADPNIPLVEAVGRTTALLDEAGADPRVACVENYRAGVPLETACNYPRCSWGAKNDCDCGSLP